MDRKLNEARKIAKAKGIIKQDNELQISNAKNKRFVIIKDGKRINFGVWPISTGTYLDHKDDKIRTAWRARHSKIMKNNKPAYLDKTSPEYYSWHILW
jgi:hypothetical protein